ncbi:MAG: hypothetical protein AB1637_02500 [Elusimicrobiota bacterium]
MRLGKKNSFIFLLFLFSQVVFSKDGSSLSISLTNNNNPMQASMVLTDPSGRKTGININNNLKAKQIPYSGGSFNYISNDETDDPINKGSMDISILKFPSSGVYKLEIFAISNTTYSLLIGGTDTNYNPITDVLIDGFITISSTIQYNLSFDPTPGAPAPILKKEVNFQLLRDDINVAYKLNQIGEEKFANSLIKMINMAEKVYDRCEKTDKKAGEKKCYRPAMSVLSMFVKRLEIANKKCDKSAACDEEKEWNNFHNKYVKDKDLKEFFSEWEKDEWHKYKKSCKRFVSEEALDIVSSDVNWYVKGIGEEAWSEYKKEHKPYISSKTKEQFK